MSEQEDLLQRINSGGFLPLNLTIQPLQQILIDIMALIKNYDAKINSLGEKIEQKANQLDLTDIKDQIIKSEKRNIDLGKRIDKLESNIESQNDRLNGYDLQSEALKQRIHDLENMPNNTSTIITLQKEIDSLKDELKSNHNQVKEVQDKAEKIESKADKNKSDIDEIKSQLLDNKFNKCIDDLQTQFNNLKAKIDDLQKDVNNLKKQEEETTIIERGIPTDFLNNQDSHYDDLLKQIDEIKANLNHRIDNIKHDITDIKSDQDSMKSQISDLQNNVKTLDDNLRNLYDKVENPPVGTCIEDSQAVPLAEDCIPHDSDSLNNLHALEQRISAIENAVRALQQKSSSYKPVQTGPDSNTLKELIDQIRRDVNQNRTDIDLNKSHIEANKSGIATNKANIELNRSAIDTNKSNIAANKANISLNRNEIEQLKQRVSDLEKNHLSVPKVVMPPPPTNDTAPRRVGDPTNETEESSRSSSSKKVLPDLTSPDASEAISQMRLELQKLNEKFSQHEDSNNQKFTELDEKIASILDDLKNRPDRAMVERLFEKFKMSLNNVVDSINQSKSNDSHYATTDDLKRMENMIKQITTEFEEAAASRKSTKCLCCGAPYRSVTGAIQDSETMAVLGAGPIQAMVHESQKPCFVYGTDHELYYSASPRGRTFAVKAITPQATIASAK